MVAASTFTQVARAFTRGCGWTLLRRVSFRRPLVASGLRSSPGRYLEPELRRNGRHWAVNPGHYRPRRGGARAVIWQAHRVRCDRMSLLFEAPAGHRIRTLCPPRPGVDFSTAHCAPVRACT